MLLNIKITGKNNIEHHMNNCKLITISHRRRVNVSVCGSGKEVILLLARKTSPFPVLEMKPLIYHLQEQFVVVALDYLGSGYSDDYHTKRTLDNVTNEIHEVMLSLGYTKYIIAVQSYAGLYSLYYANKYTDEVKAVIGIDAFVPEQVNDTEKNEMAKFYHDMWRDHNKSRILQWGVKKAAAYYLSKEKNRLYTADDIKIYSSLAQHRLDEMNLFERYNCHQENFRKLRDVFFPSCISVLFILSSYRCAKTHNWYNIHKNMLPNNSSKIVTINGKKNIHLTHAARISEEILDFVSRLE